MSDLALRPLLGLVVEGHCEFNCLPTAACRVVGSSLNIKKSHPQGNGRVLHKLAEELSDIVVVHKPYWLIAVLDLVDALEDGTYISCKQVLEALSASVAKWFAMAQSDPRLSPLPSGVSVVLEIPEYESWLIADCQGLAESALVDAAKCTHSCTNVDDDIPNPDKWLHECLVERIDTKRKENCEALFSGVKVSRAREHSKSFDKFCREVEKAYASWLLELTEQ